MYCRERRVKDSTKVTFKISDKTVVKIPFDRRYKVFEIRPLRLYWADSEFLNACNVPYIFVDQDETRLGTTLKRWFHLLGIRSQGGCGCDSTARYLDLTDVKSLQKNRKAVVSQLVLKHEKRTRIRRISWRQIRKDILMKLSDSMPTWLARIAISIVYRVAIYYEKSKI